MVMMMMKSNIQNQYAHKVSLSNIHESLFQSSPFYLLQLTKKNTKKHKKTMALLPLIKVMIFL